MANDTQFKPDVDPTTNRGRLDLRTINVPGRVFAWTVGRSNRAGLPEMPDMFPGFRRGQWDTEPDEVRFVEEETGYTCIIRRGYGGGLCGCVELPQGHPLVGHVLHFSEEERGSYPVVTRDDPRSLAEVIESLDAPGGVTWADRRGRYSWCIGFDHSHSWDELPHGDRGYHELTAYANIEQVGRECAALARELRGVAEGIADATGEVEV